MDEPVPYAVLIDRISHEVPMYRSYLKKAVLEGQTVDQQPVHVDGRRQVLRRGAGDQARRRVTRRRSLLPNKDYVPGIVPERVACATCGTRSTGRRSSTTSGCPCILKDAHGGGWKEVYVCHTLEELIANYDQSGLLTMIVQEFIEWEQFVRCLCLGQEEVLPMQYDPQARKYIVEHDHLAPELGSRIVNGLADDLSARSATT